MSRTILSGAIAVVAGLIAIGAGSVCCAETGADARAVVEANKEAIVTVQVITETTMSFDGESEKRQSKASSTGTIIDPSGLVVTSLMSINPSDRIRDLVSDEGDGFKSNSRIIDAKIRLEDGTEVPADMLLRDRDLDLAFLRPKKPAEAPYKFVDLSKSATPKILDEVVFLLRLGQVGNRSIAAIIERVGAVLTKPRTSYVAGVSSYSFGFPAFALDGNPIGISVLKASPGGGGDVENISYLDKMVPVILPCSTIMNAAEQAKTAKPEKMEAAPAAKPTEKPAPKPAAKPSGKAPKK